MSPSKLIDSLERFGSVLPAVVRGIDDADWRWKPDDGAWSILEVVTHMADEEIEDFGRRLKLTLAEPEREWPPIDPEGWARERRYNEGEPEQVVRRYVTQREESVRWLRSLDVPDWSVEHVHPRLGAMSAGELLTAWTAHDALHLRQIAKRLYQLADRNGGAFSAGYAGTW